MPLDLDAPSDITKTAKELVIERIGYANNIELDPTHFILGVPYPDTLELLDVNTALLLTPKLSSPYYNPRTFYYKRMDIADILLAEEPPIITSVATTLFELLPAINLAYGINLTITDVVDAPVAPYVLGEPARTVDIEITPGSLLFRGVGTLTLGGETD